MSRTNLFFESALEKVARIMSREHGIQVVIEGNTAYTDGKKIVLPMLEDIDEELYADLNGFLDHETAHVKYTDFKAMKKLINRFHLELFNALEDSRIEELLPREYPGTRTNLERLNMKWGARMQSKRDKFPWPIRLVLCLREIYDNKTPKIDEQIAPLVAAVLDEVKELRDITFGVEGKEQSALIISKTKEIIAKINLAREELAKNGTIIADDSAMDEVMELMETPVELDPNRKDGEKREAKTQNELYDPATEMSEGGDSESEEDEDGEDSDSDENGEGEGSGEKEESDADNSEGNESDGESQEGTNKTDKKSDKASISAEKDGDEDGDGDSEGKGEAPDDVTKSSGSKKELERRKAYADWQDTPEEQEMLEAAIEDESEFDNHEFSSETYMESRFEEAVAREPDVQNGHGMYYGHDTELNATDKSIPFSREYDTVTDYSGQGDLAEYAKRKLMIMRHINPIKQHMERVLKVRENRKFITERERGSLNTRALSQLCINKNYRTPFKEFSKVDTTNVAVQLVIDCSGSMQGNKIEVARQTGLALAESLKAIGIANEVVGFNTSSNSELYNRRRALAPEEIARFNRFACTLNHMVFKSFDSNNLSGICHARAGGANADGESITWAAKRLALRKEKRKIMIVLSDGQPAHADANHVVLAGDLKRVINLLPKAGIEPIGVGIQTDDVSIFYPDYVVVNDINTLATTVIRKLSKLIEDGYQY